MKPEWLDWSYLRSALLIFVGAIAAGGGLLTGSALLESRMAREHQAQRERLSDMRQRFLSVAEDLQAIRDYLPQFIELQGSGFIGQEQRLNWVETLQNAGDTLQLPSLGYEISAQQTHATGASASPGDYRVFVSDMNLTMQLLHEGDLLALLSLLDEQAKGFYTVFGCSLTRNFTQLTDNPEAGNISADCLLKWFSINTPHAQEAST